MYPLGPKAKSPNQSNPPNGNQPDFRRKSLQQDQLGRPVWLILQTRPLLKRKHVAADETPASGRRPSSGENISLANLSRLHRHALFVCSVLSGALVAAFTCTSTGRLRGNVKRKQSLPCALSTCARRDWAALSWAQRAEPCDKLHGLSPVFRRSFAKLAPTFCFANIPSAGGEPRTQVEVLHISLSTREWGLQTCKCTSFRATKNFSQTPSRIFCGHKRLSANSGPPRYKSFQGPADQPPSTQNLGK